MGLLTFAAFAQTSYMPTREVKAGMRGKGFTVFSGNKVEAFDAEILGVLENAGPRQSIILARLSGGPLRHTGVMQGMSGSPVYVNERLIGAVALAFTLSKDPIAGIRPFEEMLEAQARPPNLRASLETPPAQQFTWGDAKLTDIATPLSFSGFTAASIEHFSPQLRALGLEPRQGMTGGGGSTHPPGDPASLKPGSMISVQLISGDLSVAADGTVTHIEGKRIYAFGHRFVSLGDVEMPFAGAEVLTLLPNLATSFKISTARGWLGSITQDHSTALRGELGRKAHTVPLSIEIKGGARLSNYRMELVRNPALTPFLLQMSAFSAIDATERTLGGVAFKVRQRIEFENAPPVHAANIYSGEFNIPQLAAQSGAIPLSYAMQSGFPELAIKGVQLDIESFPTRKQVMIEEVTLGRRTVRPGDTVTLQIAFATEGRRFTRNAAYRVPEGAPSGTLNFTISDALISNFMEFRQYVMTPPRTPAQVLRLLHALRDNTSAYVRVWRPLPSYQSQGEDLPDPPPSAANLLGRSQGASYIPNYNSKVTEIAVPLRDYMVSGTRNVSVEVKE